MSNAYFFRVNGTIECPGKHEDLFQQDGRIIDTCVFKAGDIPVGTKLCLVELVDEHGQVWALRRFPYPMLVTDAFGLKFVLTLSAVKTKICGTCGTGILLTSPDVSCPNCQSEGNGF